MRFEEIQVTQSGITRYVAVLECWRCGEDTLETDMGVRDLCPRCESLVGDLGLDEEWLSHGLRSDTG
jgi:Zn finger protein HypA/HybF involved in hydrogenase expression